MTMGYFGLLIMVAVVLGHVKLSYSGKLYLSSSPTNGSYCPGTLLFTCTGVDIAIVFSWVVNGSDAGRHIYNEDDEYPVTISPHVPLPDSVAMVVLRAYGGTLQNVTTILMGTMSDLIGSTIQCESQQFRSEVFLVEAQVPEAPTDVVVQPTYDIETLLLSRVDVQWTVPGSECSQVRYIVTLDNCTGGIEDQTITVCRNGTLCTTFFTPPSSNQIYSVGIIAINTFGESSANRFLSERIASLVRIRDPRTPNPASQNCKLIAAVCGACFFLFGLLCGVGAGIYVGVTAYIKWNKNERESQSSHRQPTCASHSHNNIEMDAITGPPVEPQLQQNIAYEHVGKC